MPGDSSGMATVKVQVKPGVRFNHLIAGFFYWFAFDISLTSSLSSSTASLHVSLPRYSLNSSRTATVSSLFAAGLRQ